jgi:hypothetical protein
MQLTFTIAAHNTVILFTHNDPHINTNYNKGQAVVTTVTEGSYTRVRRLNFGTFTVRNF